MKTLITIIILLISVNAYAAPFVVSDPYNSGVIPDGFVVTMDGGTATESPAQVVTGGARLYYDVGGVTQGNHTVRVKAYKNDPVWGRLESTEAPFVFTRPASPTVPSGFVLIP